MRHFRNLMWFIVGVLIAFAASFSFAANIQIGTYYQYGNQITRRTVSHADAQRLTRDVLNVHLEDSKTLGITTQFGYNMESNLIQGRIIDTIKADPGVFVQMAEETVKGGMKAGIKGGLGGIAASLLADALMKEGMQMMDKAKCEVTAGCSTPGLNKVVKPDPSTPTGGRYHDGIWGGDYDSLQAICDVHNNYYASVGRPDIVYSPAPSASCPACVTVSSKDYPATIDTRISEITPPTTCPDGYILSGDKTLCYPNKVDFSYTPIPDSDISKSVDPVVMKNIEPLVNAIAKDGTTVSMSDSTPTKTTADPVNGTPKTQETNTSNPDGSTKNEKNVILPKYQPSGDGTVGGPIQINTTNTTNTTTQTCTGAGSCSTTNNTTTKSSDDKPDTVPNWEDTDMPTVPDLYVQKYPSGLKGVWLSKQDAFKQTTFMQSLQTLVPSISGGTCPSFSIDTNNGWIKGGNSQIPVPCWIYDFIRAVLMLTAAFVSRAIIFGG